MKFVAWNLLFFTLFLTQAKAQLPSVAFQSTEGDVGSGLATTAEQIHAPSSGQLDQTEMQAPLIRTLGGLGLVVCLMIAVYFAAKKLAPQYFSKGAAGKTLKVIETLSMGDKRSISLIEVADSRFLVGNTPHQINLLAALPETADSTREPEAVSAHPETAIRNEFKSPFRTLFEAEKKRPVQHVGNPLPEDIRAKMRQLREALER